MLILVVPAAEVAARTLLPSFLGCHQTRVPLVVLKQRLKHPVAGNLRPSDLHCLGVEGGDKGLERWWKLLKNSLAEPVVPECGLSCQAIHAVEVRRYRITFCHLLRLKSRLHLPQIDGVLAVLHGFEFHPIPRRDGLEVELGAGVKHLPNNPAK
ncbi:MAG: hypothetical protein AAF485_20100, partial [Chloroflexota bacterium]